MHGHFISTLRIVPILFASYSASAAIIDFETLPDGSPTTIDDSALSYTGIPQYSDGGTIVTFGFDTDNDMQIDTSAHFELRTNGIDAINGYFTNTPDRDEDLDPAVDGGSWMLRKEQAADNNDAGNNIDPQVDPFLIVYSGVFPTSASGQIWDVDLAEIWEIKALDGSGSELQSITSPPGDLSGDGKAYQFSFSNLAPIHMIQIKSLTIAGFAFDNFNATQAAGVPVPGGIWLVGIGLIAMHRFTRTAKHAKRKG